MRRFNLSCLVAVFCFALFACGGGGSSENSENVIVGQGGQVVIGTGAVQAAEAQRDNVAE